MATNGLRKALNREQVTSLHMGDRPSRYAGSGFAYETLLHNHRSMENTTSLPLPKVCTCLSGFQSWPDLYASFCCRPQLLNRPCDAAAINLHT